MINKILIKLLIIFGASFIASQIQSSFGAVDIQNIKIPIQNGQWVVADLFKPKSATKKNPAPAVIIIPGFQRSKEALSNIAIESSRKGIVAISIFHMIKVTLSRLRVLEQLQKKVAVWL